ncbi:MAG: TfoX/Sxy family protein [Pseudomonadota bacterium]
MTALRTIRGLGPASERMLAEVGIPDVETLREIGAIDAYRRLRFRFEHASLNALYALVAGLDGRDWRDLTIAERQALRELVEE